MLSVFSDDDSGSFSAQELKLRMDNATSNRTELKQKNGKCKLFLKNDAMYKCVSILYPYKKLTLANTAKDLLKKRSPETYNSLSAGNKKVLS